MTMQPQFDVVREILEEELIPGQTDAVDDERERLSGNDRHVQAVRAFAAELHLSQKQIRRAA